MLVNMMCYTCNKKEYLVRDCFDKLKKAEAKAVDSDYLDSENRLL